MNSYPSRILEEAVNEFAKLPGIGRRTALRLVLHLLKESPAEVEKFGSTFMKLRKEIRYCRNCHNITEMEVCSICSNPKRDDSVICVVEDVRDVIAIENTSQYHGKYHVLGGIISPMDGIGPSDLNIETLLSKLKASTTPPKERLSGTHGYNGNAIVSEVREAEHHALADRGAVKEVIMAVSATMEGDTTIFYLYKKIMQLDRDDIKFTTIARGVSIGDELEYADEVTLGRSILHRTPYENSLVK